MLSGQCNLTYVAVRRKLLCSLQFEIAESFLCGLVETPMIWISKCSVVIFAPRVSYTLEKLGQKEKYIWCLLIGRLVSCNSCVKLTFLWVFAPILLLGVSSDVQYVQLLYWWTIAATKSSQQRYTALLELDYTSKPLIDVQSRSKFIKITYFTVEGFHDRGWGNK